MSFPLWERSSRENSSVALSASEKSKERTHGSVIITWRSNVSFALIDCVFGFGLEPRISMCCELTATFGPPASELWYHALIRQARG